MKSGAVRIAVDMDEVLADTLAAELAWFRENFGYQLTREALSGKEIGQVIDPVHMSAHEVCLHQGHFFDSLPVMPDSVEVLAQLCEHYEIYVASAALEYPRSCAYKYDWLRRHFPFLSPGRFVFCGDKGAVAADILIDDHARHFAHFRGQGVLFTAPHNIGVTGWPRVADWHAVRTLLLAGGLPGEHSTSVRNDPFASVR